MIRQWPLIWRCSIDLKKVYILGLNSLTPFLPFLNNNNKRSKYTIVRVILLYFAPQYHNKYINTRNSCTCCCCFSHFLPIQREKINECKISEKKLTWFTVKGRCSQSLFLLVLFNPAPKIFWNNYHIKEIIDSILKLICDILYIILIKHTKPFHYWASVKEKPKKIIYQIVLELGLPNLLSP